MYETNKLKTYRPSNGRTKKTQSVVRMLFGNHKLPRLQLIILCLIITMFCQFAYATTQVSKHGITWTFDSDYTVGQFANGDHWVLDQGSGVTVTQVDPAPTIWNNGYVHGSMINPMPSSAQGYDGLSYLSISYDPALSVSFPVILSGGDSLVSTRSKTTEPPDCDAGAGIMGWREVGGACRKDNFIRLYRAAVLTVVSQIPSNNGANVFRPPYAGNSKPLYLTSSLHRDLLPKLSLSSKPSISYLNEVAGYFENVWIEHKIGWTGEFVHPLKNMPVYGREIGQVVQVAASLLMLDYTEAELEPLLINFVQHGIDLYAITENGGSWNADGGHSNGRKWPIIFAGIILDDEGMKYVDAGFGEDGQTYFGQPTAEYPGGKPLWGKACSDNSYFLNGCSGSGAKDCRDPDGLVDGCNDYRYCCTSRTWVGQALAARIMLDSMGNTGKDLWRHDAFFGYVDRWMNGDVPNGGSTGGADFIRDMWDIYRPLLDEPDVILPLPPTNLVSPTQTESLIDLSWSAPGPAPDGDLASWYRILQNGAVVGQVTTTSFQNTGLAAETSYNYEVYSIDDAGNQSTSAATGTFSTLADTTPPSIVSVSASENSVEIVFNESMEQSSAENKDFYKITSGLSSGIPVMAASLGGNLITVTLTTLSHVEGSYTLTVEAVRDISGNPIVAPASIDYEYTIGLVSYWKFDEATGNIAFDSSGSGHDGTLVNGPTWTTGKVGNALSFDGVDDYVDIGNLDVDGTGLTLTAWFKADSFIAGSADNRLISKATGSNTQDHYWMLSTISSDGVKLRFRVKTDGTTELIATSGNINTDEWVHAAAAYDGSSMILYKDGAEVGTLPKTGTISINSAVPAWIGRNPGGYAPFDGTIDEVHIYNRALSENEVLELYNSTPPALFNIQATNITSSGATITWNTNENSTSQVEYGLDNSYGNTTTLETTLVTSHSVVLTWLSPSTTYHFRVISRDASENESISQDNTFITLGTTTYSITASANSGGTISPIGTTQVYSGGAQTYTITPNTEYHIVDVLMDGSSVGAVTSYNFTNVTANHTIAASFAIDTYTITASTGSGGTIDPSGTTQVNSGSSQTYTITANAGYHVVDVLTDGSSVGAATSYSFTNVTDNHTIAATFGELDTTDPTVNNLSPQAGSIQASLNTLVTLSITDSGDGVDADSITIKVNNDTVYSGNTAKYSSAYGECYRTGTKADYTFIYQSNETFDFDQPISVTVNATDLADNEMTEYSYSFTTEMRSFGENKKVNSDTLSSRPVTVRDSGGNIWAAWHTGTTGSRDIYIGKLAAGAANFSNGIKVKDNSTDQCNPAMAVGSDDKLYVAWQDNRRGNWDIYVSTSSDGINFSTETRVTDSNDNQINPAIVVDGSNNAYIVWMDDRNGNQDIYVATSSNGFVTKTVSQITLDNSNQVEPAIAVDSDNTVYIVWTDTRNNKNDIYGAASNNGPWANIPVVTTEQSQSNPAIVTEAVGSILHLVWVDDTPGDDDIFYAKTGGGLPGSPLTGRSIIDDTSSTDQLRPAIAVSGSTGNNLQVFACWEDERNADDDLYFAELGSGAETNVFVDDDGTNADQTEPAIDIDGDGHPYLVWTDSRNTNTDIYYAGSTFIESDLLASNNISTSSTVTVGTPLNSINSVDDVSIEVPAGSYPFDIKVTISKITNPLAFTLQCLGAYDFGPSSIEFSQPVTVIIPYNFTGSEDLALAYWYNSLTAELSQQGITNVESIEISPTLHALRFKTTHFTPFYILLVSAGAAASEGGGGGGGCSMSPDSQASIVELLLPYIGLTVVMVVLKLKDKRKRKARNIT